jgi:drug/metabolite transporter (DMT)-like permease
VLFAAMSVVWGIPYLLIKVAVRHLDPVVLVCSRTAIASVVLLPLAMARRELRPVLARWRPLLAYTVAELAVPWVLLARAEERLPSSVSGLLVAAVPLVGAVVAVVLGRRGQGEGRGGADHLGRRGLAGLGVGLTGVAVLVGFDVSGTDAGSVGLVAVVVVGYALGPALLSRDLADLPVLGVVASSLALCTLGYAPFALTSLPASLPPGRVIAAVVVLGVVCTALAFVLFFALIGEIGPVRATVITYVNPAVAVVLGVAFLHEGFGVATAAGFVLILAGSVLATRRRDGQSETDGQSLAAVQVEAAANRPATTL